jgi:hypothetical protein
MIAVILCFLVSLTVFTSVAMADKRWPDRLSRRGRLLAGIREGDPETEPCRSSPPAPPAPPADRIRQNRSAVLSPRQELIREQGLR